MQIYISGYFCVIISLTLNNFNSIVLSYKIYHYLSFYFLKVSTLFWGKAALVAPSAEHKLNLPGVFEGLTCAATSRSLGNRG